MLVAVRLHGMLERHEALVDFNGIDSATGYDRMDRKSGVFSMADRADEAAHIRQWAYLSSKIGGY